MLVPLAAVVGASPLEKLTSLRFDPLIRSKE